MNILEDYIYTVYIYKKTSVWMDNNTVSVRKISAT